MKGSGKSPEQSDLLLYHVIRSIERTLTLPTAHNEELPLVFLNEWPMESKQAMRVTPNDRPYRLDHVATPTHLDLNTSSIACPIHAKASTKSLFFP